MLHLQQIHKQTKAATLVEYVILLLGIGVITLFATSRLGEEVETVYCIAASEIDDNVNGDQNIVCDENGNPIASAASTPTPTPTPPAPPGPAFATTTTFADPIYPAGTTGLQQETAPLLGTFPEALSLSTSNALFRPCYVVAGAPTCGGPGGTIALPADPATVDSIGYELTLPASTSDAWTENFVLALFETANTAQREEWSIASSRIPTPTTPVLLEFSGGNSIDSALDSTYAYVHWNDFSAPIEERARISVYDRLDGTLIRTILPPAPNIRFSINGTNFDADNGRIAIKTIVNEDYDNPIIMILDAATGNQLGIYPNSSGQTTVRSRRYGNYLAVIGDRLYVDGGDTLYQPSTGPIQINTHFTYDLTDIPAEPINVEVLSAGGANGDRLEHTTTGELARGLSVGSDAGLEILDPADFSTIEHFNVLDGIGTEIHDATVTENYVVYEEEGGSPRHWYAPRGSGVGYNRAAHTQINGIPEGSGIFGLPGDELLVIEPGSDFGFVYTIATGATRDLTPLQSGDASFSFRTHVDGSDVIFPFNRGSEQRFVVWPSP